MIPKETYIAFLRGINVGGHHKVPMAELKKEFEKMGYSNCRTLLNSGNVIFEGSAEDMGPMISSITKHIEVVFGFPIPTIVVPAVTILDLIKHNPFAEIEITKDTRLYISFLQKEKPNELEVPWLSADSSFKILEKRANTICSVLDVSVSKTTEAMGILEKTYGKDITTRNWNTLVKIGEKL